MTRVHRVRRLAWPVLLLSWGVSCAEQPITAPESSSSSGPTPTFGAPGAGPIPSSIAAAGRGPLWSAEPVDGDTRRGGPTGSTGDSRVTSGPTLARRAPATSNAAAAVAPTPPRSRVIWQNTQSGERGAWTLVETSYQNDYLPLHSASIPVEWDIAASADLNGDGSEDLIWQNRKTGERGVWLMNGLAFSGQYVLLHPQTIPPEWHIAAAADMNGDGKPDLIWQNLRTGERGAWLLDGTRYTGWLPLYGSYIPVAWDIAAVADMNGDGHADIIWQQTETGERGLWTMNGASYTGWVSLYSATISTDWDIAAVRDQDGDGSKDILWQNTRTGERGTWLMNGPAWTGTWVPLYPQNVPTDWRIAAMLGAADGAAVPASVSFLDYTHVVGVDGATPVRVVGKDAAGSVLSNLPLTFVSRDVSIASVSSGGMVTGHMPGQTILVAAATADPEVSDSLIVVVVPRGGVTVGTSLGEFELGTDSVVSFVIEIDGSRAPAAPGSGVLEFTWNPVALSMVNAGARPGYLIATAESVPGKLRIGFASGSEAPAAQVLQLTFRTGKTPGVPSDLSIGVVELNASSLADLVPSAVTIMNRVVVK